MHEVKDVPVKHQLATGRTATMLKFAFAAGAKIPAAFSTLAMTALVTDSMTKDNRADKTCRVSEVVKLFASTVQMLF